MVHKIKTAVLRQWEKQFVEPVEPLKLLLKVLREGGYAVETTFDFTDERGRKTTHGFKTLIQPDMDIVDFIPNIPKYFRNAEWMQLCDEHRLIHMEKIDEFERKIFGQEALLHKLIDGSLITGNIAWLSYKFTGLDLSVELVTIVETTIVPVLSVAFQKYGKSYAISFASKNAMRIFKAVNKIRGLFKKNKKKTDS